MENNKYMLNEISLLEKALPGHEIEDNFNNFGENLEKPWKFWEAENNKWAIFQVDSEYISQTKIESIQRVKHLNIKPVLLITEQSKLYSITSYYIDLVPYIICTIAGEGTLIKPPTSNIFEACRKNKIKHRSRISLALLKKIILETNLPTHLKKLIQKLLQNYSKISAAGNKDDYEQQILEPFGDSVLRKMGFTRSRLEATSRIRKLELSKLIPNRDHFFHSYQNYFLGLIPICKLKEYFDIWKDMTNLAWEISPFDVWFLITLWHDIGYGIQNYTDLSCIIFDTAESVNYFDNIKYQHLELPDTQVAIRDISSLILRLLEPDNYNTSWVRQNQNTRMSKKQKDICKALKNNFVKSHGAASAIQLHRELIKKVDRMTNDNKRDILFQTILLACCSIPFHDWHFRDSLRNNFGPYYIRNDSMPFAANLAFIDSIQEDRRAVSEMRLEMRFLENLLIKTPRFIKAKVNLTALDKDDILWKIIEACDVLKTLFENEETIAYRYPSWMIC